MEEGGTALRPLLTLHPRAQETGLVLLLHGAGANARDMRCLAEYWSQSLPHVKFVMPSAPVWPGERSQPGCYWFGRDQGTQALAGINEPWLDLLQIMEGERLRRGVPLSRVVIAGFSQGSSMASWTAFQLPAACAGLILLSGGIMGHEKLTQAAKATPVMYCTGLQDKVVEPGAVQQCRDGLRSLGLKVSYFEYPQLDHNFCQEELDLVQGWLKTVLPQNAAEDLGCGLAAEIRRLGGAAPTDFRIPDGMEVAISGLVAAPEHNGKTGKVRGYDAARARCVVDLGGGRTLALKPANLVQRLRVKLLALKREGAFAGYLHSEADIVGVEAAEDGVASYVLQLLGSERQVSLAPDKVLLPTGAVLRLVGLSSERGRGLVGRFCCVSSFQEGRYTVEVERERQPLNVRARHLCP